MHIILVSNRMATARTLNITPRSVFVIAGLLALAIFASALFFSWLGVRFNLPFAAELVASVQEDRNRRNEEYLKSNVSSMAVKLGEMQAKLIHLDSLSDRLSRLLGIKAPEKDKARSNAQGGPLIPTSRPLQADQLQQEIERLSDSIQERMEALTELESQVMEKRIKSSLLPTLTPVKADRVGSPFGRRVDPIAGVNAMHEGIDFVIETGTPVIASAGGIVVLAEHHPQYGHLIEIDHGNDFSSRYAHLSQIKIKAGQIVKRGQLIALSGNSGRSTGPHLHFEVRFKGAAQNPARFLNHGTHLAQFTNPIPAGRLPRR